MGKYYKGETDAFEQYPITDRSNRKVKIYFGGLMSYNKEYQRWLDSSLLSEEERAELEAEEKELEKLNEKYEIKEEVKNEDIVQCARVDIFKAYYRNQYGDVGEQIKQKQEQKNSLKQRKAQKEQTIVDRIAEYKTKSAEELETRRSKINEKFENEATSSKNKKEKGRKKGAALKESGAIGATEETYAMLKDMNEQQKKVNKWKIK